MTTVGLMSGTGEQARPSLCSRVAAVASLLLGGLLLDALPDLGHAATYAAVLAAVPAAAAVLSGYLLWVRASLLTRSVALLTAAAVVVGGLLQMFPGLPGVRHPGQLTQGDLLLVLVVAGILMALLALDAIRRKPEPPPDRPYAL